MRAFSTASKLPIVIKRHGFKTTMAAPKLAAMPSVFTGSDLAYPASTGFKISKIWLLFCIKLAISDRLVDSLSSGVNNDVANGFVVISGLIAFYAQQLFAALMHHLKAVI
jgi:hypothetical protein